MNALRQQLADGTVPESDGRQRLRELEDKVKSTESAENGRRPK